MIQRFLDLFRRTKKQWVLLEDTQAESFSRWSFTTCVGIPRKYRSPPASIWKVIYGYLISGRAEEERGMQDAYDHYILHFGRKPKVVVSVSVIGMGGLRGYVALPFLVSGEQDFFHPKVAKEMSNDLARGNL